MIKLWKNIWESQKEDREDGVAMVMAILITLVLVTLVGSMTAFAVLGIDKGTDVQESTAASNAADSAIAHALSLANSNRGQAGLGLEQHRGVVNAVYGTVTANEIDPEKGDGQFSWRWYVEQVVNQKENLAYDLYATGYQNTPNDPTARTFKVRLESTVVESARYGANGQAYLTPTTVGMFAWNAFGNESVVMKTGSSANVYDSSTMSGSWPSTDIRTNVIRSSVATNGVMSLENTITLDDPYFLSTPNNIDPNRCTGDTCFTISLDKISYGYSIDSAAKIVSDNCPDANYPDWVASANAGQIADNSTPKCYNNIVFDVDTTVPLGFSSGRPAVMMAKGNITVKPGVEVNPQLHTSQGPLALRIYSQAGANFVMERGTSADPTRLGAVVAGPTLACNIGGTLSTANPHGTALYGSLACNKVTLETGSAIWWDRQIDQITDEGSPTSKKLWSYNTYQEI